MKKLETIINDRLEKNNNLIVVFDIKSIGGYVNQNLINKNLNNLLNKEKYPVVFIDILKYKDEINELLEKKIEKFPLILKIKNKKLCEAYDNLINLN